MTTTHSTIAYCATCNEDREFHASDIVQTATIRGKPISATVRTLVCSVCGAQRDMPDHDPMEALYAAYRADARLLTPSQIRSLRERYGLSQDVFALVLGMSPATIGRYEGGALQDEVHNNLLKACKDPHFFLELVAAQWHRFTPLQQHRFNIAFQALPTAVSPEEADGVLTDYMELHGNRPLDQERVEALMYEICRLTGGVFKTKLNKLAFYVDFVAFACSGRSLTGSAYRAIQYGPVPANYGEVIEMLEAAGRVVCDEVDIGAVSGVIIHAQSPPQVNDAFTEEENAIIAHVVTHFQSMTATEVKDYSHRETAYVETPLKELIPYRYAATLNLQMPAKS